VSIEGNEVNRFRVGEQVTCFRRGEYWSAEFYVRGRQRRVSLRTKSKKQASRRAAQIDVQLSAGSLNGVAEISSANRTIAETMELYLQKCSTEDRASSTIKRYRPELERMRQFFAHERVDHVAGISLALVEKYRTQRKPHVAAATLFHESTLIKQLMNFAHERGMITANPLRKLKLKRPKPQRPSVYTLSEVERIITAAGPFGDLFELLAFTGLRIGEARWLTWHDVEIDESGTGGLLHVRAKSNEWRPKDGDDRDVPLHKRVAQMLLRRKRAGRFVFTAAPSKQFPNGGNQISDRHVLASLKRVLRRLGLADNTVHAFRHFFVSFCANSGVAPFKLMTWTGHSDLAIVQRYYQLSDDDSRRAMRGVPFGDSPIRSADGQQAQNKHN
jgi:integrase